MLLLPMQYMLHLFLVHRYKYTNFFLDTLVPVDQRYAIISELQLTALLPQFNGDVVACLIFFWLFHAYIFCIIHHG